MCSCLCVTVFVSVCYGLRVCVQLSACLCLPVCLCVCVYLSPGRCPPSGSCLWRCCPGTAATDSSSPSCRRRRSWTGTAPSSADHYTHTQTHKKRHNVYSTLDPPDPDPDPDRTTWSPRPRPDRPYQTLRPDKGEQATKKQGRPNKHMDHVRTHTPDTAVLMHTCRGKEQGLGGGVPPRGERGVKGGLRDLIFGVGNLDLLYLEKNVALFVAIF